MFIAVWLKGGPASSAPYVSIDNGKAKEFTTAGEAQTYIENVIATNKVLNYDVVIVDTSKHEVASWAAALPPALKWNEAVTSPAGK